MGACRVGAYYREYVVRDFLKVVVVCSEEPHAIGDLPALPYCFKCEKSISAGGFRLCYSEEVALPSGRRVVVEGAEVLGEMRSVSYVIRGVDCSVDPEELYEEVSALVERVCGELGTYRSRTSE
ncbi:MAG: hypothetical protein RMH84_03610 [Sulfolobales archaeon]|nr:hypothetical protein [Sulfolobales archaeon]MDW8010661.1 hypothetical protein [Sulfolobales archaeon]